MISPAIALAVLFADLQAQLADARADIEALCEGVCEARRAGVSAAVQARAEIVALLAERHRRDSDACGDGISDDAINALDAPPVLAPGHPESVTTDLDDDTKDEFSGIVANLTGGSA